MYERRRFGVCRPGFPEQSPGTVQGRLPCLLPDLLPSCKRGRISTLPENEARKVVVMLELQAPIHLQGAAASHRDQAEASWPEWILNTERQPGAQ